MRYWDENEHVVTPKYSWRMTLENLVQNGETMQRAKNGR